MPLISVVTITFNHAKYIRGCVESVLSQKINHPIEHIIADDCSTDGTLSICQEFESLYPQRIKLISRDHNVGYKENELRAMKASSGKYIAFLEGDDYWTNDSKLQKQVDFLESHPDYSCCFTRWENVKSSSGEVLGDGCDCLFNQENIEGIDIDTNLFFAHWCTQPLTMVFRKECLDLDLYTKYKYYRDMHQIYHLLQNGKGYLFSFVGGRRTMHNGGIASLINNKQYCDISVPMDGEFYRMNKNEPAAKEQYLVTLQTAIYVYKKTARQKSLQYCVEHFCISHNLKRFLKNLCIILS